MKMIRVSLDFDEEVIDEEEDEKTKRREIEMSMKVGDFLKTVGKEFGNNLRSGVTVDELTVVVDGTYLSEESTFEDSRIQNNSVITLKRFPKTVEKCGGGLVGKSLVQMPNLDSTTFSDPKKKLDVGRFGTKAKAWRSTWDDGMHMECICTNNDCEWKNEKQVVCLGIGEFDIVYIFAKLCKCGKCKKPIKGHLNVRRAGFCNCRYKFEYILEDYSDFESDWKEVPNKPCWMPGEVDDENSLKFKKLVFKVERKRSN